MVFQTWARIDKTTFHFKTWTALGHRAKNQLQWPYQRINNTQQQHQTLTQNKKNKWKQREEQQAQEKTWKLSLTTLPVLPGNKTEREVGVVWGRLKYFSPGGRSDYISLPLQLNAYIHKFVLQLCTLWHTQATKSALLLQLGEPDERQRPSGCLHTGSPTVKSLRQGTQRAPHQGDSWWLPCQKRECQLIIWFIKIKTKY